MAWTYEVQELSEGFSAVVYDGYGLRVADHLSEGQAELIVRAVNSHEALVEALRAIMSDRMNGPDSYLIWQQARAAIKAAEASA